MYFNKWTEKDARRAMRRHHWWWLNPRDKRWYNWRWALYFVDWLGIETYKKRLGIALVIMYQIGKFFLK